MNRPPFRLLLLLLVGLGAGCMQAAKVFLDLPEPDEHGGRGTNFVDEAVLDSLVRELRGGGPELPPPPVEGVSDVDSILALLPRDAAGGIDWVQAADDGVIRPRAYPPGGSPSDSATVFPFDFYLGRADSPEAYFPHSTHVATVSCGSCHPAVYAKRNDVIPSAEVHQSASCATCHGPVAFPMQRCERCHDSASDLPKARVEPTDLGQTYQLLRLETGSAEDGDDVYGGMGRVYEPASFPHGKHRLRYQCRACHQKPFPMRTGAVTMSQEDAHSTRGCGYCHDGGAAFDISMSACYRCHLERPTEGT